MTNDLRFANRRGGWNPFTQLEVCHSIAFGTIHQLTPTQPGAPTTPQVRLGSKKRSTSLNLQFNRTGLTLPCPPEWATWLQDSFIVPGCLIPHGGDDILPDGTESASLGLFGPELRTSVSYPHPPSITHSTIAAIFQDHSSSTFTHDLLCVGDAGASKHWFITAAEDWLEVTEYLRERDGSRTVRAYSMSPHELSRVPFDMYAHTQKKGELVVLPPRRLGHRLRSLFDLSNCPFSYCQTIHQGITASLRWERMTLRALETFIYHDMIFKQRYDNSG